jgi:hypothetical protein
MKALGYDSFSQPVKHVNGDLTLFFGKWFIYSNNVWILDEICSKGDKHTGTNKLYNPHPVNTK